jgi:perosamine synthetase
MFNLPPLSRQRIYSSATTYLSIFSDLITARVNKGNAIEQLESQLSNNSHGNHAVCMPQARVGLHLAVKALLAHDSRKKVILSPYTIFAVVNMVISAGGIPVFADIERETCNIDPSEIERLIDYNTAAVLVTHLHGLACDMDRIVALCDKYNLALIEDAAQSQGSRWKGRLVGSFGDVGVYSFGMMKNINSLYGGAVLTSRDDIAEHVRTEINSFIPISSMDLLKRAIYGLILDVATLPLIFRAATYWVFRYGYLHDIGPLNMLSKSEQNPQLVPKFPERFCQKFSQSQARLVLQQLQNIDANTDARINTAQIYFDELTGIPGLRLPPRIDGRSHTYMAFPVQMDDRDALIRHLLLSGRDVAGQHLRNCADLSVFSEYESDCPNAATTAESVVLLPTYPRYGHKEAIKTARAVRKFFEG